jgi:hypothetical protein
MGIFYTYFKNLIRMKNVEVHQIFCESFKHFADNLNEKVGRKVKPFEIVSFTGVPNADGITFTIVLYEPKLKES